MSEQQKFLLWQYADLVEHIAILTQQEENEDLLTAMQLEQARMEDEYEERYGDQTSADSTSTPTALVVRMDSEEIATAIVVFQRMTDGKKV